MLVTFKSKAAAEVIMYQEHAKRILDLFNKDIKRGVITAAEAGPALAKLSAEIAASRQHPEADDLQRDAAARADGTANENEHEPREAVSFATRAFPLQQMLRAAQQGGHDIAWGI